MTQVSLEVKKKLQELLLTPEGRVEAAKAAAASIRRCIGADVHLRYRHLDGELTEADDVDGFRYASLANCSIFPPYITIIQQEVDLRVLDFRDEIHACLPQIGFPGASHPAHILSVTEAQLRCYLQFRETHTPNGHLVEHFDVTADRWVPFHEPISKEPS